jgi:hypothetical protein
MTKQECIKCQSENHKEMNHSVVILKDYIKMDLIKQCEDVNGVQLAQDWVQL